MLLLAHRGSPAVPAFENTVPAVVAAFRAGADGVEVDVRLCADDVLVLSHDADLARLTGRPLAVADETWPVLHAAAQEQGVGLARVEWLLAAAAGRPVVLELKQPPPAPRARARTVDALMERLAGLHAAGLPLSVTVSSFDASLVRAVRTAAPAHLGLRTALLGRPGRRPSGLLRQALAAGHDEVHPHVLDLLATPGSVASAHACGLAVVPWTVNARRAVQRCADLGVEALITDVPAAARRGLRARPAAA